MESIAYKSRPGGSVLIRGRSTWLAGGSLLLVTTAVGVSHLGERVKCSAVNSSTLKAREGSQ